MNYSLEKISTVEGCDALLTKAQKKKLRLERTRRNLGESIDSFVKRVDEITQELASVQLLLNAFIPAHAALPEGSKYKINLNVKLKRLELRQARLHKRAMKYNVRSLLEKQLGYNRLDNRVSAITRYIVAVHNKRTALRNTTLRTIRAEQKLVKSRPSDSTKFRFRAGRLPVTSKTFSGGRSKQRDIRQGHAGYRPGAETGGWPIYARAGNQRAQPPGDNRLKIPGYITRRCYARANGIKK